MITSTGTIARAGLAMVVQIVRSTLMTVTPTLVRMVLHVLTVLRITHAPAQQVSVVNIAK